MTPPRFDGLEPLEADLQQTAGNWELLQEFSTALGEMADKSWLDFRGSVFDLQDLATAWAEKVRHGR